MPVSGRQPDLPWLADAPLFIDGQQIGAFYDAVVGRGFRAVQLQLSAGQAEQLERSAGGRVNAGSSALFGHDAPLQLRNEVQLGFKQVKWLTGIDFVASFTDVGGGHGGYNPDHEFFGYRQSI
jgi:hypothetical protein